MHSSPGQVAPITYPFVFLLSLISPSPLSFSLTQTCCPLPEPYFTSCEWSLSLDSKLAIFSTDPHVTSWNPANQSITTHHVTPSDSHHHLPDGSAAWNRSARTSGNTYNRPIWPLSLFFFSTCYPLHRSSPNPRHDTREKRKDVHVAPRQIRRKRVKMYGVWPITMAPPRA